MDLGLMLAVTAVLAVGILAVCVVGQTLFPSGRPIGTGTALLAIVISLPLAVAIVAAQPGL